MRSVPGLKVGNALTALAAVAIGCLCALRAPAEIERIAEPAERGFELNWWPRVTPPDDWIHHREASLENHLNMFVRKGETFADAPVILYARAIYFENGNTEAELETAIRDDQQGFVEHFPGAKVAQAGVVETGDGTQLRTFSFTPTAQGTWDLVAYGREPKYVLMFCISARSAEALAAHRPAFVAMVRSYTSAEQ